MWRGIWFSFITKSSCLKRGVRGVPTSGRAPNLYRETVMERIFAVNKFQEYWNFFEDFCPKDHISYKNVVLQGIW